MISLEYILAALLVILVPGTGVIYTIGVALMNGRIQVFYAALGCTFAITPHLLACVFGVAAILDTSALLFNTLKLFGVLYLLYFAYGLYKDKGILEFKSENIEVSSFEILKNGFLINVLNPKLSIFFLAFIPQFVSPSTQTPIFDMIILGLVFMGLTLFIFLIYGVCAGLIKNKLMQSNKIVKNMKKCFAVIFAILAYKLSSV
ncbi:MAG: LysE family translocator [Campylobacteraceae bacterium]|nr:LysE family translocator [Campylobacteraceae bacterium]